MSLYLDLFRKTAAYFCAKYGKFWGTLLMLIIPLWLPLWCLLLLIEVFMQIGNE